MLKNKLSFFSKRYRMQILAALATNIMNYSHGVGIGWVSPTVQILQSPDTPLDFPVNVDEVSWIGSMYGIGVLCGNIFFGLTVNRLTHKCNLYIMALPHIIFWILNYLVQSVEYLYAGRFLAGVTTGGLFVIVSIFVSEVSDKEIRGVLMSVGMLLLSCGVVTGFILPTILDYYVTPCIALVFPVLYLFSMCFFPETPQSLLKRNRLDEAEAAFNFYKGVENIKKPQMKLGQVETNTAIANPTEFEELKAIVLRSDSKQSVRLEDFLEKSSLKAFANSFVFSILYQLSGSFAFLTYMNSIFAVSGSTLNQNISTYIVGLTHIIASFLGTVLVQKLSRRMLLFSSVSGMTIGMLGFGAFVQFADAELRARLNWVPLVFMMIVIFASAYGLFANYFTIAVEILPAKIRSQALSISMSFTSIMIFVVLKLYPYFLFNLGIVITMYSTSFVCVITGIYLYIFLPETRGKSMEKD